MENKSRGRSRGPNDLVKSNNRSQSRDRSQFKDTRECFFVEKKEIFFFFLISNKNSLIVKKIHPSTQGVYMGE